MLSSQQVSIGDIDSIVIDEATHRNQQLMAGLNRIRQGTSLKILKLSADSAGT